MTKKFVNTRLKSDLERTGLFQEMSYITVGDPYVGKKLFKGDRTGKQLITGAYKAKCADQSGYFAQKFLRLSEGDPYKSLAEIYRKKDRDATLKSIAGPFNNGALIKMDCGKGSFCATINPCPSAMSPVTKNGKKDEVKLAFLTSPGKKGSGYGYLDVTIGPYISSKNPRELNLHEVKKAEFASHMKRMLGAPFRSIFPPDRFFDASPWHEVKMKPAKSIEYNYKIAQHPTKFLVQAPPVHNHGFKMGTINKFPPYEPSAYKAQTETGYPMKKDIRNKSGHPYIPPGGPKSRPVFSTIQINLNKSLNGNNYNCLESQIISC